MRLLLCSSNRTDVLQAFFNNTASEEEIQLLKRLLASRQVPIGGNVNQSVIILGSGNTVVLPPDVVLGGVFQLAD